MFPDKPSNHGPVGEELVCRVERIAEDCPFSLLYLGKTKRKRKMAVKGPSKALVEFLKSSVRRRKLY